MTPPYFPFPSVLFLVPVAVALTALMAAAAWIDWTTWRVPKRLTLSMLALGVVAQMIGGAWMAAENRPGWMMSGGVAVGLLDGLLFALAGAATGFGLFFTFWILGVAGGGDVKLATALGAWLGPRLLLGAVIFSLPVVAVIVLASLVRGLSRGKLNEKPGTRRMMTFSLPLAVATLAMFLVMFRVPLGLTNQ